MKISKIKNVEYRDDIKSIRDKIEMVCDVHLRVNDYCSDNTSPILLPVLCVSYV